MKICTACDTAYSDDTLNFCLVDGTTLTPQKNITFEQVPFSYNPGSWSDAEVPTRISKEPVTFPNSEPTPTVASFPSTPSYIPRQFSSPPPASAPNRSFMYLAALVGGTLIFGVVAGVLLATNWNKSGSRYPVASKNFPANTAGNSAVVTNAPVYTNSAPASNLSNTNKTASQKIDLTGMWKGKFNEAAATLNITTQNGATFSGTLSKNGYLVEFTGRINQAQRTVAIKETKVLKTPPNLMWNLGTDDGTISENGKTMGGTGSDKNVSYAWSFTRE
jgi:hypothetical protein